jgi:hypothetical protein
MAGLGGDVCGNGTWCEDGDGDEMFEGVEF